MNNTEGFTDADVASDSSDSSDSSASSKLAQDGSTGPGSAPAQDSVNPGNINSNNVGNDGGKVEPNPLVSAMNMGPYDGICLKTGNKEYWMKSPDDTSLLPNDNLYSYENPPKLIGKHTKSI